MSDVERIAITKRALEENRIFGVHVFTVGNDLVLTTVKYQISGTDRQIHELVRNTRTLEELEYLCTECGARVRRRKVRTGGGQLQLVN